MKYNIYVDISVEEAQTPHSIWYKVPRKGPDLTLPSRDEHTTLQAEALIGGLKSSHQAC